MHHCRDCGGVVMCGSGASEITARSAAGARDPPGTAAAAQPDRKCTGGGKEREGRERVYKDFYSRFGAGLSQPSGIIALNTKKFIIRARWKQARIFVKLAVRPPPLSHPPNHIQSSSSSDFPPVAGKTAFFSAPAAAYLPFVTNPELSFPPPPLPKLQMRPSLHSTNCDSTPCFDASSLNIML